MKSPASFRRQFFASCLGALFLAGLPVAPAQEAAAPSRTAARDYDLGDEPLVIANGKFTRDGQTRAATVKNLVDVVRQRYPDANITAVGVDDIVIDQLTLQWARYRDPVDGRRLNPPLKAVLTTLAAASGRKFVATAFSEKDVLLEVPEGLREKSGLVTEVFNLSPYLTAGSHQIANLEKQVRDMQLEMAVLQKRYADKHPTVLGLKDRLEETKAQLAQSMKDVDQKASDLVEQIDHVVRQTLARQQTREQPPDFQFHRGSNLLVITGSDNAVNLTRKVIAALEKNY